MTTLAYRDGVFAADSRVVFGGWRAAYEVEKLYRLPDGTVCGLSGDYSAALKYAKWLADGSGGDTPSLVDSTVVQLLHDGSITIHEDGASFSINTLFEAWGSGSVAARAAMYAGASASRAVEIASLLDENTGGQVRTMKCETT